MRRLFAALCLGSALAAPAFATPPVAAPARPVPAIPATPLRTPQPGQVQPLAPGTRPAPKIPTLTLTPAIPQVHQVTYLSNGFIEVAHAVITVTPQERPNLRPLVAQVAAAVLAARPTLSEVDLSVYDRGSYAGFGGPLPLLTASVPRERLGAFLAWTTQRTPFDRVWVNPGNLPVYLQPDRVRETVPVPVAVSSQETALERQARKQGGLLGGCSTAANSATCRSRPSPSTTRRTPCTSRCCSTCCAAAESRRPFSSSGATRRPIPISSAT
ncbi:hypothetical protein [Deinococcus radiodurans]|uniref:hypothetical protein n=1 Tax=Deinococcus radiodurans TaxID=1299 RepID=UPI001D074A15|nr:hypothetical protein [Deinococcus radiodurans]UTA51020.1 hypothetical protein MSS93_01335 [Deinococcus radiodurans]